ncbi:cysteine synthase A [Nitrospirota bacterium]
MNRFENIIAMIGGTPILRVAHCCEAGSAEVWAKLEGNNPGGSVKDRISLSMIEDAEKRGELRPGDIILEPTSGNTGIGLAMVARLKGYKLILTMPDTMSVERRQMLAAFGAELALSPGAKGMGGACSLAEQMLSDRDKCYMPQQFDNPSNPDVHRRTTAMEIIEDLDGTPDAFVAGVGTGGTITGVGEAFKERNKNVRVVAVEPASSPVLSGGDPGPHKIAGIGAGFIPGVLNRDIIDDIIQVTNEDAAMCARELALREGVFCGISSGAAMWAARKVAKELGPGKKVVVIFPDRGEKYLSTGLFSPPGNGD